MRTISIQPPFTEEEQEFLEMVMVTGFDGAHGSCDWFDVQAYQMGQYDGFLMVQGQTVNDDGEPEGEMIEINLEKVAEAITKIPKPEFQLRPEYKETIVEACGMLDAGDIDGDLASIIIQVAALGEIVYG